jgi:thiamine transport system permease protein
VTGPARSPRLAVWAVAAVVGVVCVPVVAVLLAAVRPDGSWGTDALERVLTSSRTWRLVVVTVGQAALSCLLTLVVGVPAAFVLYRLRFRGRAALLVAVTVPFVLPTVVVGAAVAAVLGPGGLVDARGTWFAVLAAHLAFNLAVVVRTVGVAFQGVPVSLTSSARVLGLRPSAAFRRAVLPAVAPAVGAASVVVFLYCLTSFGVLLVLGGGRVSTVEVEIWVRATRQFDVSGAAVLSVLQLLAVVGALAVYGRVAASARGARGSGTDPSRRPRGAGERLLVASTALSVLVVAVLPVGALFVRSFQLGTVWSADNWLQLGSVVAGTALSVPPLQAVWYSLVSSSLAAGVAVLLGVAAARGVAHRSGGASDRLLLLPLGVSATTVGLGMLLAVGRPPVDLRASWWVVPLVQAVVALPLVVRVVAPAIRSVPPSLLDAAAVMGRSARARWWEVELPAVRPAVASGAGLALVACLGEFGATAFVVRSDRPTVPVLVARLLGRPGAAGYGQAMALSCVLVVVCAVVLALVDRAGRGSGRSATVL